MNGEDLEVPGRGRIHAADLRRSPRLQKLFRFLYERGARGATGGAIVWKTRIVGLSVAIWELRQDVNANFKIECVPVRRTKNGSQINRWVLDTNFTEEQRSRLGWLLG